jgi:hypothetical protein
LAKKQEIENIQSTIKTTTKDRHNRVEEKKRQLAVETKRHIHTLGETGAIERCHKEIESLECMEGTCTQIADIEKENTRLSNSPNKIEECEKRINAKFKFVTFRLFEYTLDAPG